MSSHDPARRVAVMRGDPAGVGPEVTARAIAALQAAGEPSPLVIGSGKVLQRAIAACGLNLRVAAVPGATRAPHGPGVADVLDPGNLDAGAVQWGCASAANGRAVYEWVRLAEQLGEAGDIGGWVMGPINSQALKLAGVMRDLDDLQPPGTYVLRLSGPLRVVPISEHIPLDQVPGSVTREAVLKLLQLLDSTLKSWGMSRPRLAVAGLNPHAMGRAEEEQIAPAVQAARQGGLDVTGPVSPDAVFRQCVEGRHDAVVSMYHDQGQIAVKTAVFAGACSVFIGLPYVHLSMPHGTAYDIAGTGTAQHQSMLSALRTAGALARGEGFL